MNKKNLYLSEVPDNFDRQNDLVIHFGWFSGREEQFPTFLDFAHPEPTKNQLIQADCEINLTAKYFCGVFGHQLESKWGLTPRSQKFWIIVLYPYISHVLQTLWGSEKIVDQFIEKYKQDDLRVHLVQDNLKLDLKDTQAYVFEIRKIAFNAWLFSRILEKKAPKNWAFSYSNPPHPTWVDTLHIKQRPRVRFENFCYGLLESFGRYQPVYGLSPIESVLASFLLWGKPAQAGSRRADETVENLFCSCLDVKLLLERWLPESLNQKNKYTLKQGKVGKLNLGSRDLINNDDYKIKIALALEQGERLAGVQHGGHNYGSSVLSKFLGEVEYSHDVFLTWGYQHQQNAKGNLKPLPSPLLCKMANAHREENRDMILVGTNLLFFSYLFLDFKDARAYRLNKEKFFSTFSMKLRQNLIYRPYFNDDDSLSDKKHYAQAFPWLKFHEGHFHKDLLKCRLLILDHLGTTLNLAMAANTPTICFWSDNMVHLTDEAANIFDHLKRVGILFHNAEAAVAKISEIFQDVQGWWAKNEVQEARRVWCDTYARTSPSWRKEWIKTLWEI